MYFDLKDLGKLSSEQKAKFESMLSQFPELQNKLDISRQLNTGSVESTEKIASAASNTTKPANSTVDEMDFSALEQEQKITQKGRDGTPHLGTVKINPADVQASFDRKAEEQERREEESVQKQPANAPVKPKFSTAGKEHPALTRIKMALKMDQTETFSTDLNGSVYVMKKLNKEEVIKASSMAQLKSVQMTEAEIKGNVECALLARSLVSIDGVPTPDLFGTPAEQYDLTKKAMRPSSAEERLDNTIPDVFNFFKEAPSELVDTLVLLYDQNFPAIDMLHDSELALCPSLGCQYKAVLPKGQERYCPVHGKKLTGESKLENPS